MDPPPLLRGAKSELLQTIFPSKRSRRSLHQISALVSRRLSNQRSSSPARYGRFSLLHSLPMPPRVAGILSASPMARPAPPSLRGPSPPWRLASVSQAKTRVGMQLSPLPAAGPAALRLLSGSRATRLRVCVCVVERGCAGRGVPGARLREGLAADPAGTDSPGAARAAPHAKQIGRAHV